MSKELYIEFHTRWFYIPAIITIAFLSAFWGVKDCYKNIREFTKALDEEQKKIYDDIRKEREQTYWQALMQGCFVAVIYIIFSTLTCSQTKPMYHLATDILCLVFVTTYFVYTLKEKKKVMLIDGDLDDAQEKKWISIYRCMQKQFWSFFLMGLIFSGFLFSLLDLVSPPIRICVLPKKTNKKKQRQSKK